MTSSYAPAFVVATFAVAIVVVVVVVDIPQRSLTIPPASSRTKGRGYSTSHDSLYVLTSSRDSSSREGRRERRLVRKRGATRRDARRQSSARGWASRRFTGG